MRDASAQQIPFGVQKGLGTHTDNDDVRLGRITLQDQQFGDGANALATQAVDSTIERLAVQEMVHNHASQALVMLIQCMVIAIMQASALARAENELMQIELDTTDALEQEIQNAVEPLAQAPRR